MTTLAQYERARAALAEATRIDQVLPIGDEIEHVKLYARQIQDRALLADAYDKQLRFERRLGEIIKAAKDAGHFREGRPRKNGSGEEPFPSATLAEVGVDKKLSARAQQRASISERAFEAMVERTRERVASDRAKFLEGVVDGGRSVLAERVEPDDSLDYFPTPPWATRALIEAVLPAMRINVQGLKSDTAWEPACGEGHIAEVLKEYFGMVIATDIFAYGYGEAPLDFLGELPPQSRADWIITNPPFGANALPFVERALDLASMGVAMFVRSQWAVEGVERYNRLFRDRPPTVCAFFTERVNLCKGRWEPTGSTAMAYCWLVWAKGYAPQPTFWIPPGQREALTRDDDRERFTAHPVIKRSIPLDSSCSPINHDEETGEVVEEEGNDDLDIPAFLRRTA